MTLDIRLSRHAKNKARLYKLAAGQIQEVITLGERASQADKVESSLGDLRVIWVTVGSYVFVITVIRIGRK